MYPFIADSSRAFLHLAVDHIVPRNSFIAAAASFAGWYGHRVGMTYSQNYINNIIMRQLGCMDTNHSIANIVTDITETVSKNVLASAGAHVGGFFDYIIGGDTVTNWMSETVGNVTSDTSLMTRCSEGIRCLGADAVAPIITPEIAPYMATYVYGLGAMIVTSLTLNLIALAILKLRSCFSNWWNRRNTPPIPVLPPPLTPIKQEIPLQLPDPAFILLEARLKEMELKQLEMHTKINEQLVPLSHALKNIEKNIETALLVQPAPIKTPSNTALVLAKPEMRMIPQRRRAISSPSQQLFDCCPNLE